MAERRYHSTTSSLVYSFGCNNSGELGLNDKNLRQLPTLLDFSINKDIVDIACGKQLTALLTSDGQIYTCGLNENGQCGVGTTNEVPILTRVSSLAQNGIHIDRIFSGNGSEHLAAVSTSGELYTVGYNSHGQLGLGMTTPMSEPAVVAELLGVVDIAEVACTYFHTIIRATNGMLYACGQNDLGQLGVPDGLNCHSPKPIQFFNNNRVLAISCGENHTIVSLESGGLMAFGKNEHGQLGIGTKSDPIFTPTPVVYQPIQTSEGSQAQSNSNLDQQQQHKNLGSKAEKSSCNTELIIFPKLACGYNHTVAVSDEGTVYAFGSNGYGQLGLGHTTDILHAEILASLLLERIVNVNCGSYHTIILSDEGKIFPFGKNDHGQLGLNTLDDCWSPQIVPSIRAQRVQKVAAGLYHSVCLVENTTSQSSSTILHESQTLSRDLRHILNNQTGSDVTFVVEEKKIFAHSLLLSARCEPMQKMLDGRMCDGSLPEIKIPEYSYNVFLAFLEYLYTSKVESLTSVLREDTTKKSETLCAKVDDGIEFILELLQLADQYLVLSLRKMCENSILRLMSVENVSLIFQNAHFRSAFEYKKRCLKFILNNFNSVIATNGFVALPTELLLEVLQAASKLGAGVSNLSALRKF